MDLKGVSSSHISAMYFYFTLPLAKRITDRPDNVLFPHSEKLPNLRIQELSPAGLPPPPAVRPKDGMGISTNKNGWHRRR
jgi:hypothetical protein